METIKKYSNWIIIGLLVLFLGGNMKSCSKERKIHRMERIIEQKDSLIAERNDSIKTLNYQIQLLETEKSGYQKNIELQNDAINKISEAKKNINVVVKNKK